LSSPSTTSSSTQRKVGYPDFTLPVAIIAQAIADLKVDVVAQSIGFIKVDIAAQSIGPISVNIAAAEVALNVNVVNSVLNVNIAAQSVLMNVNIQEYKPTLTNATLHERGLRVLRRGNVYSGVGVLYEVPEGKTAYLVYTSFVAINHAANVKNECRIKIGPPLVETPFADIELGPGERRFDWITGIAIKMFSGERVVLEAGYNASLYVTIVVVEV